MLTVGWACIKNAASMTCLLDRKNSWDLAEENSRGLCFGLLQSDGLVGMHTDNVY